MSFIEMFGYQESDRSGREEEPARPPWLSPPDDELGVAVAQGIIVGRSEQGAVGLSHAIAYRAGVAFDFLACARGLSRKQANALFHEQHQFDDDELPDGFLRVGMELPGGARVSNLGGRHARWASIDEAPPGPVLLQSAGGGGMAASDQVVMHPGYWLWPLPEAGSLRISCEWPVVEIPLTTVEMDACPLVAAAARSVTLWPTR